MKSVLSVGSMTGDDCDLAGSGILVGTSDSKKANPVNALALGWRQEDALRTLKIVLTRPLGSRGTPFLRTAHRRSATRSNGESGGLVGWAARRGTSLTLLACSSRTKQRSETSGVPRLLSQCSCRRAGKASQA